MLNLIVSIYLLAQGVEAISLWTCLWSPFSDFKPAERILIWNYKHDYPWIVRQDVLLPINCVNKKMLETF